VSNQSPKLDKLAAEISSTSHLNIQPALKAAAAEPQKTMSQPEKDSQQQPPVPEPKEPAQPEEQPSEPESQKQKDKRTGRPAQNPALTALADSLMAEGNMKKDYFIV
jgi:hypothetical protein